MQTAIKQMIEELQNGFLDSKFNSSTEILLLCVKYQYLEKEQIKKSFQSGFCLKREISSEEFYNKNFK